MAKGNKFRKKFRTRLSPTAAQKSYIDRVSNPTSPGDLWLALQDPSTPAYKQMMHLIAAREENQAIIVKLVQLFLVEQYQISQKEKDEIFKNLLAQERAEQKNSRQQYELNASVAIKPLHVLGEEKLKEKLDNRALIIKGLSSDVTKIKGEIAQLEEKAKETTQAWQTTTKRQREDFLKELQVNQIAIQSSSGKIIDKDDPRHPAMTEPAVSDPVKIVGVVAASHALHQTQKTLDEKQPASENEAAASENAAAASENKTAASENAAKIPLAPAPPPPPAFSYSPKFMAQKSCVLDALLFMANLGDTDSAADLLKAIANNKKASMFFPGAKKDLVALVKESDNVEKSNEKSSDTGLNERADLFAQAIHIHDEKTKKQEALMTKQIDLSRETMLQEADQKALDAIQQQDKHEKSSLLPPEKEPQEAKPSPGSMSKTS